jgi:hypothetical protein
VAADDDVCAVQKEPLEGGHGRSELEIIADCPSAVAFSSERNVEVCTHEDSAPVEWEQVLEYWEWQSRLRSRPNVGR